ncbi:MAG: SiaB family protein kinase [Candidatus Puniceispirillaceae bacterium]
MDFQRFNQLSHLLLNDEFVLSYSGYVSEEILRAVGDTLRERLSNHISDHNQIRNIFSIFVELMQNIIRYGDDGPQPAQSDALEKPAFGIVMISQTGDNLSVMAGNFVTDNEAQILQDRINDLATCSADELRQMYRNKLREPVEETSKGASLGLIEIARRSSLPLSCEVMKDKGDYNLFMIKATV